MSENQNNPSIVHMNIDNYAMGNSTSNIINNYLAPSPQNSEPISELPNQVLESLTIIKKYLARQPSNHEIKITKNEIKVNDKLIHVNYEACKICKLQHGNFFCLVCEKRICSNCVVKRSNETQCVRCKNAKRMKNKIASEFDEKITKLLNLETNDKIREIVLVEVENLGGKNLEELIAVVKKLEKKGDKLDREISIAYFYVGKFFYEKMEDFFIENELTGKEKSRKILASFRYAKDLDFGNDKMSVRDIKEKLGINDTKLSRFFNLNLKIYLSYQYFDSPEERIRKAENILPVNWLRDLSQEKFLDFLGKLNKEIEEEKEL